MSPEQEQYKPGPIEATSEIIAEQSQGNRDRLSQRTHKQYMELGDQLINEFELRNFAEKFHLDPKDPTTKDLLTRFDEFVRDPDVVDQSPIVPKSIDDALELIYSRQEKLMDAATEDRKIERGEPLEAHKRMTLEGLLADHKKIHPRLKIFRLGLADPAIESVLTQQLLETMAGYLPKPSHFSHNPSRKDDDLVLKSIAVRILTRQPAKAQLPESYASPSVCENRYKAWVSIPRVRLAFQSAVVRVMRESAASNDGTNFRDQLDDILRDIDTKISRLTSGPGSEDQNRKAH
jgi:hypothetical protein